MSSRRGGSRWQTVRRMAFNRDVKANSVCWICGRPIDYTAPANDPDSWEPDHVKPVSLYPELEFDLSNIRPSHASCNRSRGNGTRFGDDRLGNPSRKW